MRSLMYGLLGIVGGFVAGVIISEIIAVTGHLLLDDISFLRGLRYMPFVFATAGAFVVPLWVGVHKRSR